MPSHFRFPRILIFTLVLSGCASAGSPASTEITRSEHAGSANATHATESVMDNDPASSQTATTAQITLDLGAEAKLPDGSRLAYLSLVNDSRCPPNVQCIWAGNAEIRMRWTPAHGGRSKEFSLNTSPVGGRSITETIGAYSIRIHTLARGIAPAATFEISLVSH